MRKRDGRIVNVFGVAGAGKTTVIAQWMSQEWKRGFVCLLCDITDDCDMASYAEERFGVPSNEIKIASTAIDAERRLASYRFVVIRPDKRERIGIRRASQEWLTLASELRRDWCYAIDEGELVLPNVQSEVEDDRQLRLCSLTRNCGSTVYVAGKRPQRVSIDCRAMASDVLVMHLDSRRAVSYGCQEWGSPDEFERALKFEPFQALYRARFVSGDAPLEFVPDVRDWEPPWMR